MPSHRQRSDKKRSHKHRHRNRSRSSLRKHNILKKNEGKKENIPYNTSSWNADLRDISTYMENRREMIRQMFSSVGEDFLTKSVPFILKKATREELKKLCFEELTKMSADVVFQILEGIPFDYEPNTPLDESSKKRRHECKPSKNCCGHPSKTSSLENFCKMRKDCDDHKMALSREEEEGVIIEDASGPLDFSCSGGSNLDSEKDDTFEVKTEVPSTSYQLSVTKKLAKIAPFHISIPAEVPHSAALNEEEGISELGNETSYEIVDLGLEEDIVDVGDESNSEGEGAMDKPSPHATSLDDSDRQEMTEEEMQQNLSEMLELEHRARAIRSMLANIDRFQA